MSKQLELAMYGDHLVLVSELPHENLIMVERLALIKEPRKAFGIHKAELTSLTAEQQAAFSILTDKWIDR